MGHESTAGLRAKKCLPCEGGVDPLSLQEAQDLLPALSGWGLDAAGKSIERKINCDRFTLAIELLNQIADIAESEQHHPDLHLTGYRHVRIVLTTHAIGGLSENDFIVAAKIDGILNS